MNRLSVPTSPLGVRRGMEVFSHEAKLNPAIIAPAGSNWSSHGGDEMGETPGIACHELVNLDICCGSRDQTALAVVCGDSRSGRWPGFRADRQAIHPDYRKREKYDYDQG